MRKTRFGAGRTWAAVLLLPAAGACASAGAMPGAMMMNPQGDMAAHAFVSAVDAGEIQQGMLASDRAMDPAVRMYAASMVAEHSHALRTREMRMSQLGMGLGIDANAWMPMDQQWAMGGGMQGMSGTQSGQMRSGQTSSGQVQGGQVQGGQSGQMASGQMQGTENRGVGMGSGAWAGATIRPMGMLTAAGMTDLHEELMENPASRPVAEASMRDMQALSGLSGAAFDRAYIGSQIDAHTYALQNLDRMIAQGAVSPEVLGVLQAMRASVAAHLELAQQIQTRL